MLIHYKGTNVLAMGHINAAAMAAMRRPTKQNKNLIQSPQDVKWLRPGWNEFPTEVWEQNKANPQIVKMLKKGEIELLEYKARIKIRTKSGKIKVVERMIGKDDKPIRLKHFDESMAIKMVKGTLDRDILQRWMDEETRHKVKKALRKQIEPLLNTSKDEDEEETDDYGE